MGANQRLKQLALSSSCTLDAPACILGTGFVLWALQLPFRAKGSYFWVPAAILSKGFGLWALELPFRAKGSYFWRSSCHFEQGVRTLGAPDAILSKGVRTFGVPEGERGEPRTPPWVGVLIHFFQKHRFFTCFWPTGWPEGQQGGGRGRVNPLPNTRSNTPDRRSADLGHV